MAGGLLLERVRAGHEREVSSKSTPTDLVSEADLAAERAIRALLATCRPQDGFVGEEGGEEQGSSGQALATSSCRHPIADNSDRRLATELTPYPDRPNRDAIASIESELRATSVPLGRGEFVDESSGIGNRVRKWDADGKALDVAVGECADKVRLIAGPPPAEDQVRKNEPLFGPTSVVHLRSLPASACQRVRITCSRR